MALIGILPYSRSLYLASILSTPVSLHSFMAFRLRKEAILLPWIRLRLWQQWIKFIYHFFRCSLTQMLHRSKSSLSQCLPGVSHTPKKPVRGNICFLCAFFFCFVLTVKNPYFLIILWIAKVHFIYFRLYTFISATTELAGKKIPLLRVLTIDISLSVSETTSNDIK